MTVVELIIRGPFPRLVIVDRTGETHEIELSTEALYELEQLGCDSCGKAWQY